MANAGLQRVYVGRHYRGIQSHFYAAEMNRVAYTIFFLQRLLSQLTIV